MKDRPGSGESQGWVGHQGGGGRESRLVGWHGKEGGGADKNSRSKKLSRQKLPGQNLPGQKLFTVGQKLSNRIFGQTFPKNGTDCTNADIENEDTDAEDNEDED